MISNKKILTVSDLNREIKYLLEDNFPFIWVTGEISNFSKPTSGHFYFTLKDSRSMVSSVMFRGQNRNLKFLPENGMSVTGFGRVSLYEPRGAYQIIFEYLEPKGIGSLQVAFEQLKIKLEEEGLFKKEFKKKLPSLPKRVAIITSPTGSVVHDLINIISRRFFNVGIDILKVKVQGDDAVPEIVKAIKFADLTKPDAIIIARGGGSIEDLAPFNSEKIARVVFDAKTPVISAIGHETDFTILDFVADLRAETPSAAAELLFPEKDQLISEIRGLKSRLTLSMDKILSGKKTESEKLIKRLKSPGRRVSDQRLRLDDLSIRIVRNCTKKVQRQKETLLNIIKQLYRNNPSNYIEKEGDRLKLSKKRITIGFDNILKEKKSDLSKLLARLENLNPLSVLERGYSITRTVPGKKVIGSIGNITEGQNVEVLVSDGTLNCKVEGKK
ncbi:MAG: exodeoxyribonuclease VII large subunit [Deltaproteobacteria bacterium]|nr:exodeoxyribonuclease VII large subunit [Deltaproteobacteria bacterium]